MYPSFEKYIGKRKTSYRALLVSHFVVFIFELILLLIFFNRKRIEKKILFLRLFLVKIRSEIPIEKVSTLELFVSKIRGESHRTLKTFVNNLCFAFFSLFFLLSAGADLENIFSGGKKQNLFVSFYTIFIWMIFISLISRKGKK